MTTHPHAHEHAPKHPHPHADLGPESAERIRIQRLAWFLEAHFGDVELHMPEEGDEMEQGEDTHEPSLLVTLDEADAVINLLSMVSLPHRLRQSGPDTSWTVIDRDEFKRVAQAARRGRT